MKRGPTTLAREGNKNEPTNAHTSETLSDLYKRYELGFSNGEWRARIGAIFAPRPVVYGDVLVADVFEREG